MATDIDPTNFWRGDFGDEYMKRNDFDYKLRLPFWRRILDATNAGSFLEIGCNRGGNLRCLAELSPEAMMSGVDVNEKAVAEALAVPLDAVVLEAKRVAEFFGERSAQLAFTCGVLIHIPAEDLKAVMEAIVKVSSDYVLAVEYHAPEEQEVEYRGHKGKLWRRDYGKLYQEMGLSVIETGPLGRADGFDDCQFVLLERPR